MRLNAVKILKISITINEKKEILEDLQKYLKNSDKKQQKSLIISTPNTEQLVLAQKNQSFAKVLKESDLAIPDSIGVVWAVNFLTKKHIEGPLPGIDFIEDLTALALKNSVPIGLIGGFNNVAIEALECLQKTHNGLQGWGVNGPEITSNADAGELYIDSWVKRITESKVKIVFVGLGPPKQEFFIAKLKEKVSNVIFMAVGGSFDILSGRIPRAPQIIRTIGLEWLWRLVVEPWRWKRQLALIEFVRIVLREKLSRLVSKN